MRRQEINSQSYEGFETWYNQFKMTLKMFWKIFIGLLIVQLIIFSVGLFVMDSYDLRLVHKWLLAKTVSPLLPHAKMRFLNPDGRLVRSSAGIIANTPWLADAARETLKRLAWMFLESGSVFLFFPFLVGFFKKRSKKQSQESYIRGSKLISAQEYAEQAEIRQAVCDLPFGSIRMPISAEIKHTFLVGRPGTGKTVLASQVLDRLKARDGKGIVYDFKGEYLSKFYDPDKDLIFNPLDGRSLGWNLFNELETYMDVDAIAASLIPPSISNTDPFWNDAARGVFTGILHYLYRNGFNSNQDIWDMLTADGKQIAAELKKTRGAEAGYRYIEDASSKQALSVFAVMMQYTKCFEYMAANEGDFSVKDWLQNDDGFIFITNYADVQDTLKPVLSLFIDLLGRKLLSLPNDINRRIFFILDEFGTLQRLSSILKLLTLSRSKGGAVFIGIQDIGQIEKLYSSSHRQSIVNACGNSVIFSVEDNDTARYCSDKTAETEYMTTEKTISMGVNDNRDGISLGLRPKKEPLFLPSDIKNLPDLTGIVKFSNYHYVLSEWQYQPYQEISSEFELREDLLLDHIISGQQQIKSEVESLNVQIEGLD